ncbi:hypothetical protein H0O02_01375 [Candidatus Micrarchaeota archaeon]|nr:hypothetical protein [Candidatus Micrarchaeota archaeon]
MCAEFQNSERKKHPGRVVGGMETWRRRKRAAIKPQFGGLEEEGIDREGNSIGTRSMEAMGIYEPHRGTVTINFRRNGYGPRTVSTTDVYKSIRQTKHIEEWYIGELEKNDRTLQSIGTEVFRVRNNPDDRPAIEEAIGKMTEALKSLGKLRAEKKRLSLDELRWAVRNLQDAIKDEGRINGQKLADAFEKYVLFRKMFGPWRDTEVVHTKEYSKLRGYALRKLRDEWLLENTANWIRYLEKEKRGFPMKALWARDLEFSGKLEKLLEHQRIHPEELAEIKENLAEAGYRVRKLDDAEELLWKIEDMKEILSAIGYRARKTDGEYKQTAKRKKEARRQIKDYVLLLRVRNPLYAAEEMKKESDDYCQKAARHLDGAAILINRNRFDVAVERFRQAEDEIRKKGTTPQMSLGFPSQSQQ